MKPPPAAQRAIARRARRLPARLRVSTLVVLVLALHGVASFAQGVPAKVNLPAPTGPYAVGRLAFEWTDAGRLDPFAPEAGTHRTLTGFIWYPARPGSGRAAPYVPPQILAAIARQADPAAARLASQYAADQANVTSHARSDAALPAGNERYPVLLMKPGRGALVVNYASLAEELASQGYVVAASDSPYTSPVVVHRDGSVAIRNARGAPPENTPGRTSDLAPGQPNDLAVPVVMTWAADNRFVLDRMAALDADSGSPLFRRLDLGAVGAFGHSMGGAAGMQWCRDDARCKAVVNLDGALWGEVAVRGLDRPALFVFSDRPLFDRDNSASATHPLLAAIDRVRARVASGPSLIIVRDSRHYNFADSALFTDIDFARRIDMLGLIDPGRGIEITRGLLRSFFDLHLKGGDSPFPPPGTGELRLE